MRPTNIRFADDTTLSAESEAEMKQLLERVERERERPALSINKGKTKIQVIIEAESRLQTNFLSGYDRVDTFIYLGCVVGKDGGLKGEKKTQT